MLPHCGTLSLPHSPGNKCSLLVLPHCGALSLLHSPGNSCNSTVSFIFVVHQVRYAALLLPNCGAVWCPPWLQGLQVGVCLLLQGLFHSVCVAGLSIPQCVRVAGSPGQSVCCCKVYTTVCVLQVCLYQSGGGGCCRVPISVFVVVGTIQQCLLWGLYHSVCCCEDYTTLFVVARTIPQRLFLQGLYHSVLVFAGSVSDSACPSIRVPVAAEERPAAEVCPVSDQ